MKKPSEVVITIKPKFDTEALEMLRVMHLRMAAQIGELIESLSHIGTENDISDEADEPE